MATSRQRGSAIAVKSKRRLTRAIWTGRPTTSVKSHRSSSKTGRSASVGQGQAGLAADVGAGERRSRWSRSSAGRCGGRHAVSSSGRSGSSSSVSATLGGRGGEHGGVEAVQDLVDPGGVGAEDGHELRGGHLLPLAGEECLEPQQVRRVPRGEHRQRAEQADPGPGRARFARRAVQPGQLIGAGRGEHVPCARRPVRRSPSSSSSSAASSCG